MKMANEHNIMRDEIREDEVQMLGTVDPFHAREKRRRARRILWIALPLFALTVLGLFMYITNTQGKDDVEGLFESANEKEAYSPLGGESMVGHYTERIDTLVDGHPFVLFIPHHASPSLYVGLPDAETRNHAVLALQAADIRADNHEILGDFVLAGEQLTRGVAKKGYCAIIGDRIAIGVAEDTPLLASTISQGGYFFRQYPLVDQGAPVDNKPKGKSIRKALCERGGQVFAAVSVNGETFHDFARLLVSLGVDNAIYLVGGQDAFGWTVGISGEREEFGQNRDRVAFNNESYIVWE